MATRPTIQSVLRGPVTPKDLPETGEKPEKTRSFSSKDPLDDLIGHSITYRIAMGPRAGIDIEPARRQKLEGLCRYVSRPPVAVDRIALMASGQVRYTVVAHMNPDREVYLITPELIPRTITQRVEGMHGVAAGEPSGQVIERTDRHLRHLSKSLQDNLSNRR